MRVTDRDGERVGGVIGCGSAFGKQHADHHADLRFLAVAGSDDRLFTRLGAYSATGKPGDRRHQHGDAARLPEFQRRRPHPC